MKINSKILSIPPYISALWMHVASIYTKNDCLFVHLTDNSTVEIPHLDEMTIDNIFKAHALSMEKPAHPHLPELKQMLAPGISNPLSAQLPPGMSIVEMPFQLNLTGSPEDIGASSIFQHNPLQQATPDIPNEIIEKIISVAKVVAPDDLIASFPKPEPHCNCVHCQIGRTIHPDSAHEVVQVLDEVVVQEEPISDADLQFQKWKISRTGEQLYAVTNPDTNELYSVHLGSPVGCTCGEANCEHIVAVLRS